MKRFGKVISLAAVVLVAAMACKGSGGGGAGAASAASLFPKDSGFVIGFSFSKFRKTELWSTLKDMADKQGGNELAEFKEVCNIDAMTAVDSFVMAMPADQNPKKMAVIINGKISEKQAIDCAKKIAEKEGEKVKIEKTGKVVAFVEEGDADDGAWASWLSDDSVLFTGGGKEHIESMLAGKDSLKNNADMMAMMKKVDTGATFWGVGSLKEGPAAMATAGMPFAEKPVAGYVSVDYTKSLSFKMGLAFENDGAAKAAAEALTKEVDQQKANPMVGTYLKDLKVSASGKEAVISLKMDEQQLTQLTALVKGFLPMMMGGM